MLQIPVCHSGSLKDRHFFTTGSGSASRQQHRIDTYCSPPLLHLQLIKFGQISQGKKKLKGEQKQVVVYNADCGEAPRREFAPFGRVATYKTKWICGRLGGDRMEGGGSGERRGR